MLNADSVNKVILMGRIGTQPHWHVLNSVRMLCFSVITTEKIKRAGQLHEHEEWHQIRISEKLVDAKNIAAGKFVYIQGRLQTRQAFDEQGIKHYKAEVIAYNIEPVDIQQPVVQPT